MGAVDHNETHGLHPRPSGAAGSSPQFRLQTSDVDSPVGAVGTSPSAKAESYYPKIDGYRITGVLGQGGMGIVYRAVQTKLNRAVALKVLPAMIGKASPNAVARFRREATAAARLHHTHIVPIYDFGESHDAYYYAMELIEGQPISTLIPMFSAAKISGAAPGKVEEIIRQSTSGASSADIRADSTSGTRLDAAINLSSTGRGRAYYQQVARWMADAADALQYAHTEGIIHRDIKPANLILSVDGRIMVADFGLAKSSEEASVTVTGALLGTVRYLSPEQAMAKRIPVDHRTDIYSLGATLYELLCFEPAFPGLDDKQILAAIIQRDPIPPRKVQRLVPSELETICMKTLEKAPDSRYETARAMVEDLRRYMNDLPIVAKRPSIVRRVQKFTRRRRALTVGMIGAILLAATGGLWWYQRGRTAAEGARALAAQVESIVEIGNRYFGSREWHSAAEAYQDALVHDPNCVQALHNLAISRKEQYNATLPNADAGLLRDALQLCDRALAQQPELANAWNTKGVLLKMLNRFDEAIAAYQQEMQLSPNPFTWANFAQINVLQGQIEEAVDNINNAVAQVDPKRPMTCAFLRDLAIIQMIKGEPQALATVGQSLQCRRDDARSLIVQARVRLLPGTPQSAETAFLDASAADRLFIDEPWLVKRYLALACLRLGRFDEAIASAKEALRLGDMPAYSQLIIAIAESQLAKGGPSNETEHRLTAKTAYDGAFAAWPPKLQKPGDYEPSAVKGFLWFESADELLALRAEAESLSK